MKGIIFMAKTRTFISFDYDHDSDLKSLLVGQAKNDDSPFSITDMSIKETITKNGKIMLAEESRDVMW